MDDAAIGPVDFVLVEFPDGASTAATAAAMGALLDSGVIHLYDIAFVACAADGSTRRLDFGDAGVPEGYDAFAGAASGLFDADDVAQAASVLEAGTVGVMLAYENAWAGGFVSAAHAAGGRMVASERIPAQALLDVLDAVEAAG